MSTVEDMKKRGFEVLDSMVGLSQVKKDLHKLMYLCESCKENEEKELFEGQTLNYVFMGNPGTGKTMLARLIGQIYRECGVLSSGHLVQVTRSDLVGAYIGQTPIMVKSKVRDARGGVLFIDEAYNLIHGLEDIFGNEAINTLLSCMEDYKGEFAVVLAGYATEMKRMLDMIPGLARRCNIYELPDYTPEELADILRKKCVEKKFVLSDTLDCKLEEVWKKLKIEKMDQWANAREVDYLLEKLIHEWDIEPRYGNDDIINGSHLLTDAHLPLMLQGVSDTASNTKKSQFNFVYKRGNTEYVMYNTYSKALVLLTAEEYKVYENNQLDEVLEKDLLENGFLIDKDFDEKAFLTYCHNITKYSSEALHLVLATTMDCNFGCPYCYENRRKGKMNQKVQDAIVDFILLHLEKGIKQLDVTWYGGEPLLYPDLVKNFALRIGKLLQDKKCDLNMYMVTNGYLLTEEIVQMLDEIGVLKVQITLDGMQKNHDARRHLKNGAGTFNRILQNLSLFEEYPIRVDVRMNVDNENCYDYLKLQKELKKLDNPNIILYPSPVEDINHDTINEVSEFMSYDEFERFAGGICKEDAGVSAATSVLDDRYCYCQAETMNSYVIDELGNCYKCWDQVGRVETSCFNILSPDDKNYNNIVKFMSWDPWTDEKCSKCVFLPVCFGGCKFHRMNTNKYDCGFTDESMKSYIESTFFDE